MTNSRNEFLGWRTDISLTPAFFNAHNQIEHVADFIIDGQARSFHYGQIARGASCSALFQAALWQWENVDKFPFFAAKEAAARQAIEASQHVEQADTLPFENAQPSYPVPSVSRAA